MHLILLISDALESYMCFPFTAPEGQGPPMVDGFNSSAMQVMWDPPIMQNGPNPSYQVQSIVASLSRTPPRVERGARFTGGGYYLFSGNILPFSSYTGKISSG